MKVTDVHVNFIVCKFYYLSKDGEKERQLQRYEVLQTRMDEGLEEALDIQSSLWRVGRGDRGGSWKPRWAGLWEKRVCCVGRMESSGFDMPSLRYLWNTHLHSVSQTAFWTFGVGWSLWGACPEHWGMFSSILGLLPPDARSVPIYNWQPKCLQILLYVPWGQNFPTENHFSREKDVNS